MKFSLCVALLSIISSAAGISAEDCVSEPDDTLLLQTSAETAAVMKDTDNKRQILRNDKRQIHRFRVHVQDDLVSLLQGSHTIEATVYQICADDDAGSGEEEEDSFATLVDTCGPVTVSNEAGDVVARLSMCAAFDVAEDKCFSFVESPDFFDNQNGSGCLVTISLQDDVSDTSDVFLVELPDMDGSSGSKAMEEIKKKTDQFPGAVLLFHGKHRTSFVGSIIASLMLRRDQAEAVAHADRYRQRMEDRMRRDAEEEEDRYRRRLAEEAAARQVPPPAPPPPSPPTHEGWSYNHHQGQGHIGGFRP